MNKFKPLLFVAIPFGKKKSPGGKALSESSLLTHSDLVDR
jgi:hypothetical protein